LERVEGDPSASLDPRPTPEWPSNCTHPLRSASPPKHLILDHDRQFGPIFAGVAEATGIDLLPTGYRAPREHAIGERFLGSVRRECRDHRLVLSEAHHMRILREFVLSFHTARPHQGLQQRIPAPPLKAGSGEGPVGAIPVLGGLRHRYERVA
jgi:putative transposase